MIPHYDNKGKVNIMLTETKISRVFLCFRRYKESKIIRMGRRLPESAHPEQEEVMI